MMGKGKEQRAYRTRNTLLALGVIAAGALTFAESYFSRWYSKGTDGRAGIEIYLSEAESMRRQGNIDAATGMYDQLNVADSFMLRNLQRQRLSSVPSKNQKAMHDNRNNDTLVAIDYLIGLDNENPDFMTRLDIGMKYHANADACQSSGDMEQAQKFYGLASGWYERSLELNPNNAGTHFRMALLELSRGNIRAARYHHTAASRLEPFDERVSELEKKF